MPSANCYLYLPGTTTLATGLVDGSGTPISNPFLASSVGQVEFGAPNGVYDLRIAQGARDFTIEIQCADLLQALNETASFLGAKSSAPTTRNDGSALQIADRYFNTSDQLEYLYKSTGWVANNLDGQLLATIQGASLLGAVMQDGSAGTVQQAIDIGDKILRQELSGADGGELMGYARSELAAAVENAKGMFDASAVNIWEYGSYADKSGGPTYDLWDWTPAFSEALNSGLNVNVGNHNQLLNVSGRVELKFDNQIIFANGGGIKTTGSGTAGTIVYATGLKGVKALGLRLEPGAVTGGLWTSGSAILFDNCTGFAIENNDVSKGRRGISVADSSGGRIAGNYCHDSIVRDNPAGATQFGADIGIYNNCKDISVEGNTCVRGCGQGITVQTNGTTGHTLTGIAITGNTVRDQDAYGILLYSDGANAAGVNPDVFRGVTVTGNTVENITGLIPNPADGSLSFGAGIYIQGAEGVVVSANTVRKASLNTVSSLLAPGGIGVANARSFTLTGNIVEECGKHGIFLGDPLQKGSANGTAIVTGNTCNKNGQHGIHCNDFPRANIEGNTANENTGYGIFCRNQGTTSSKKFIVTGNTLIGNLQNGLTIAHGDSIILGNTIENSGAAGLVVGSGTTTVGDNMVIGSGTRGIEISAGVVDGNVHDNTLDGNMVQMFIMSPVRGLISNTLKNLPVGGTAYGGNYLVERNITGATPDVKNGEYFNKTDTVSVTNLLSGYQGQEIVIRAGAAFTLINGGAIATATGADVNLAVGRSIVLRFIATAWRQSV